MTKTNSTSKGTLYGIRFNQKTDISNWGSPYAWLNYGDDWYLVKYAAPIFFVKWFPFLMNRFSHEAWKIEKRNILNNPIFQIPDGETVWQPEDKLGSGKYTLGIVAGPIVAGLLYKLTGIILPTNNHPTLLSSLLLMAGSLVVGVISFIMLAFIFKEKWLDPIKKQIPTTSYKQAIHLINKQNSLFVSFKMPIFNMILVSYIRRIGIILIFIATWFILFFGVLFFPKVSESSAVIASYGIIISYMSCMIILILRFLVPVVPYKWHNPKIKNVLFKEDR